MHILQRGPQKGYDWVEMSGEIFIQASRNMYQDALTTDAGDSYSTMTHLVAVTLACPLGTAGVERWRITW